MSNQSETVPDEPIQLGTAAAFDERIDAYDVVLVDFYADWCGPCQMMEPAIKTVAAETEAAVLKVDVDQFQELAGQYQVQGVPTLLVVVDGEIAERMVGAQTGDSLLQTVGAYTA